MALQKVKDSMRTTTGLDATKLSGAVPTGSLGNAPDPDLTPIRSDIAILALKESAIENRVAYGTNDTFIDHFQDSTGVNAATSGVLKGLTDTAVNASEYVSSISSATVVNDWTIEWYANFHSQKNVMMFDLSNNAGSKGVRIMNNAGMTMVVWVNGITAITVNNAAGQYWDANAWQKFALIRDTDKNLRLYQRQGTADLIMRGENTSEIVILQPESGQDRPYIGGTYNNGGSPGGSYYYSHTTGSGTGYMDEWRISSVARHTGTSNYAQTSGEHVNDPDTVALAHFENNLTDSSSNTHTITGSGTGFSGTAARGSYGCEIGDGDYVYLPNGSFNVADEITEATANATGSIVSTVQTAASSVSEVSGVYLYEDADGNSTPGTQLKIYFTSNNGVNYYEADSYTAAGTFSGNIKMVKLGKTTMTVAGTQVAMKAVWASQVTDSMVQRLHGWAVNY